MASRRIKNNQVTVRWESEAASANFAQAAAGFARALEPEFCAIAADVDAAMAEADRVIQMLGCQSDEEQQKQRRIEQLQAAREQLDSEIAALVGG